MEARVIRFVLFLLALGACEPLPPAPLGRPDATLDGTLMKTGPILTPATYVTYALDSGPDSGNPPTAQGAIAAVMQLQARQGPVFVSCGQPNDPGGLIFVDAGDAQVSCPPWTPPRGELCMCGISESIRCATDASAGCKHGQAAYFVAAQCIPIETTAAGAILTPSLNDAAVCPESYGPWGGQDAGLKYAVCQGETDGGVVRIGCATGKIAGIEQFSGRLSCWCN